MGKNQFVVKHGSQWAVKGANNTRATKITGTQREAISIARQIAKNQHSELRVQDHNGHFRKCNSYGNDSCPPSIAYKKAISMGIGEEYQFDK